MIFSCLNALADMQFGPQHSKPKVHMKQILYDLIKSNLILSNSFKSNLISSDLFLHLILFIYII